MTALRAIVETLLRKALALWQTLWFRVVAMGLLALAAVGLSQLVSWVLPIEVRQLANSGSADRLLDLIANAMLAVTIFSLTVMVSVYAFSASQWTPRVHRLIVQDRTTQNTLSTFIGAFVFAVTAIALRALQVGRDDGGLVMFALAVGVLVLVVLALIRWVLHLQEFGSLDSTTRQVETITARELGARSARPCLGGRPFGPEDAPPEGAEALLAERSGYVAQFYQASLQRLAERQDCEIWLPMPPGHFIRKGEPIVWVTCELSEELADELRGEIAVGDARGYVQDPRLGLIVLGEIGSKALSPGINDSGTAIDVITRLGRLLEDFRVEQAPDEPDYPHLRVPPLMPADLIDDGLGVIARDGAGRLEVQSRLQDVLASLMDHPDAAMAAAARHAALREYSRAWEGMEFEPDRERLRARMPYPVLAAAEKEAEEKAAAVKEAAEKEAAEQAAAEKETAGADPLRE